MAPTPFLITYDASVTAQQRQWFEDALVRTRFAIDRGSVVVNVETVAEPSCPGHKDYMCTHTTDGVATIEIRETADDATSPLNAWLPNPARDIKPYFQEAVIHELGHAFFFKHFSDAGSIDTLASYFQRFGNGNGSINGTAADWNPLTKPWEDRIQEALAEFFKDVYLDPEYRVFDNRTNWNFNEAHFGAWLTMVETIICPAPIVIN